MKFKTILPFLALPLAGCYPASPRPPMAALPAQAKPVMTSPAAQAPLPSPAPAPSAPAEAPHVTSREVSGILFEGVAFDSRNHRLVVVDQPNGPASRFENSAVAANSRGGIAAVNAGFFTPEGAPLGLVVSSGKISGSWNTASSLGSGIWSETKSGGMAITRREKLGRDAGAAMRELIQAGPLLVENSRAVSGLEASKSSVRTVILWNGTTRWWIGCSSPCTLANLGETLATGSPGGWPVQGAINLDGGRSSDLWVSPAVTGGPLNKRLAWNRPVRNFLILVAK